MAQQRRRSTSMRGGRSSMRGGPTSLQARSLLSLLRALQVRHEDLAAAALEIGMWPVKVRNRLGDEVTHRIVWIPGVLEDIDKGGRPSIETQGRTTGDRKLLVQTPVGSRDRDRSRLRVDHGRRCLLLRPGGGERG